LKFVAIADTHSRHHYIKLPKGDVLIHAGDVSYRGEKIEIEDFFKWFSKLDYPYKILIAGNHDFYFEKAKQKELQSIIPENIIYLNDSGTVIDDIKIWGSPVTPQFFQWAFNKGRGSEIRKHWNMIPEDTDILVTHGPPFGILDQTINERHVGCKDLLRRVVELKPSVHVFGHIHEAYGTAKDMGVRYINASQMNDQYQVVHKPIIFEVQPGDRVKKAP
jgi:Icc-related predicted phosphoesterase